MLAISTAVSLGAAVQTRAQSQEDAANLSKQLNNPISSLISVPLQFNYNENIGPNDEGSNWA